MSLMRYREQKYIYGNYMEVNMYPVYACPRSSSRKKKRKPTSKVQERLNQINAERALARLIPANFTDKDYKFELTYAPQNNPADLERAKKDFANFVKRVNRARVKRGFPRMKYIYSIEQGSKSGRIHFHVIMTGGLTINDIASIWGKGYVDKVLPLMFDQTGCAGIAKYFCKQKISDHNNGKHAKRYVASTNCIKPQPQNNDYRLTKRAVQSMAYNCDNPALFENMYQDYYYADCRPFWNEDNGTFYISLFMYRRTAKLNI